MIVSALLNIMYTLVNGILNIFPTTPAFPTTFITSVAAVWGFFTFWSYLFPVNTLVTIVGLMFLFQSIFWTWQGLKWLISVVRGM